MTSQTPTDQPSLLTYLEKNPLDLIKLFIQQPEVQANNLDPESRHQIVRSVSKRLGQMKSIRRLPSRYNFHDH